MDKIKQVLEALQYRTGRLIHISRYFMIQNISTTANENFVNAKKEGLRLNRVIQHSLGINQRLRDDIENYLIQGEETVLAAGIEVLDEFCPVRDILDDLRDERLFIMILVDNILKN